MPDRFPVVSDLKEFVRSSSASLDKLVVVEKHPKYDEGLIFQNLKQSDFTSTYHNFVSAYHMLSELFMLKPFVKQLEEDGYVVVFTEDTRPVLDKFERWSRPLVVEGLSIPNDGTLYPFQQFALQKALERVEEGTNPQERLFFFGMGTGTGKSVLSAAGAQELFNRDEIDLVIAFTLNKLKINLSRNFNNMTTLKSVVIDGEKSKRVQAYRECDFDVLVTNYEKCHFDFKEISAMIKGKRVLWVMDEVQKVIKGEGRPTKARLHLNKLVRECEGSIVWPMSASVVSQTPLRYYDLFTLHGKTRTNILGPKYQFEDDYLESRYEKTFYTKSGGRFDQTFLTWDKLKLEEVRHRVSTHVQSIRKTDPGIRETFKGMQTVPMYIQMSERDRELYDIVSDIARSDAEHHMSIAEHARVLRYICNTPEVLRYSESDLAKYLVKEYPQYINSDKSSKLEVFLDQVEQMAEAQDKVVAFTQFTNLTLFTLHEHLERRKIKHVIHYGTGMTPTEAQRAQDVFKANDEITLFLSSDAGAYGLNLQEARFVINYEPTYSYDTLMQRGDRINRADSYLDGLTSYVYLTENTIEENVWKVNNSRRKLASATQGTRETLNVKPDSALLERIAQEEDGSIDLTLFSLFGEEGFVTNL